MQELWFLRSASRLKLIDIYMKFHVARTVFKLYSGHDFVTESKGSN